jgi:hypothetical protein
MPEKQLWLLYVALAGLAWGTYVPFIFYGGNELGGKTPPTALGARLMAILCVGVAYFVLAILIPLLMFGTKQAPWPELKLNGLIFSGLAGVAGAVGAICVIFATRAAMKTGTDARLFIGPLIFGLAPVINTLVSSVWQPGPGNPLHFELVLPGWKLWVGILLVGLGAALVLYSKDEAETAHKHKEEGHKAGPAVVATVSGSASQERKP